MIVLRWATALILILCFAVFSTGVRDWFLAAFTFAIALLYLWSFRRPHLRTVQSPRSWLVEDISEDHEDGLTEAERRYLARITRKEAS